ncbi:MAG: methylmalonyl-CoA mutase family protein [Bacillota bacterium]|nr:methylmalonyl-CoA mutase family protein [Bacillota bacterium]
MAIRQQAPGQGPQAESRPEAEGGLRKPRFLTRSEMEVPAFVRPEQLAEEGFDYERDLGDPGEYPFTRGIHPTMYRGRLWTMREFAGFGDAAATNRRFHYLLEQGQTGLSVAFDFPTLLGYDSDAPVAEGEVGRMGVAVDTLADMERLFEGIPLDRVSTSMTINGPAMILFAMYLALARKRGIPFDRLNGTIQNDILKEYTAQKTYIFPIRPSLKIITDIMAYASEEVPRWNTISISGYHIREAGATAVQELAFTLADGFTYVEEGIKAGLDVDRFAPRLSFFWDIHLNFFEEIAKIRAARRIWAREMRERFGARNPRSWTMRFHSQTAGVSLTAQQPEVNIVRTAFEALAAVLAGTQSLHTNSFDEALALPTEEAVRLALRTQQVIAEEIGVADTVDPLAGSYYVEWLTRRMERAAYDYFRRIEEAGGVVAGIENGFFQREIADAAYRQQLRLQSGEEVLIGVNKYVLDEEQPPRILRIDPAVEREQVERLRRIRSERDPQAVAQALERLERTAREGGNLMPALVDAASVYASEGEMADALRSVYGVYHEEPLF